MTIWKLGQPENVELTNDKEYRFTFSFPPYLYDSIRDRINAYPIPVEFTFLDHSVIVNNIQLSKRNSTIIINAIPYGSALLTIAYVLKWVIIGIVTLMGLLNLKKVESVIKSTSMPVIVILILIVIGLYFISGITRRSTG